MFPLLGITLPQIAWFPSLQLLRLCLWVVMAMPVDSLVMMAPDCSSWGVPSRGTSRRNFINSYGNVFLQWIQSSNCMFSRCLETKWWYNLHINSLYMNELSPIYNGTSKLSLRLTLVCLLVMANNCIWVIEQPRHSLAGRWKRFEWMVNYVAWVPWNEIPA